MNMPRTLSFERYWSKYWSTGPLQEQYSSIWPWSLCPNNMNYLYSMLPQEWKGMEAIAILSVLEAVFFIKLMCQTSLQLYFRTFFTSAVRSLISTYSTKSVVNYYSVINIYFYLHRNGLNEVM